VRRGPKRGDLAVPKQDLIVGFVLMLMFEMFEDERLENCAGIAGGAAVGGGVGPVWAG